MHVFINGLFVKVSEPDFTRERERERERGRERGLRNARYEDIEQNANAFHSLHKREE